MSRSNSNQVGRSNFRSLGGCCICGTKSSSSRFTLSQRYSEHFLLCFGNEAEKREGDLCNACVLCVKRWLQRGKTPDFFAKVLDSKKGPGPKHMKEITKRARRREDRARAALLAKAKMNLNRSSLANCKSSNESNSTDNTNDSKPLAPASSPTRQIIKPETSDSCGQGLEKKANGNKRQFSATDNNAANRSTRRSAFQKNREASPNSDSSNDYIKRRRTTAPSDGYGQSHNPYRRELPVRRSQRSSYMNTRSSHEAVKSKNNHGDSISWVHHTSLISYGSDSLRPCCCQRNTQSFYHSSNNMWNNSGLDESHGNTRFLRSSVNRDTNNQTFYKFSSQSSVCSSTSTTRSRTCKYNRRVILPPVRMCLNEETDQLLRQIMEKNSQALDAREVHMAVQRKLRGRSRQSINGLQSSRCSSTNEIKSNSLTNGTRSFYQSTPPSRNQFNQCSSSHNSDIISLPNFDSASSSTIGDSWSSSPTGCNVKKNSSSMKTLCANHNNTPNGPSACSNNNACENCWCCIGYSTPSGNQITTLPPQALPLASNNSFPSIIYSNGSSEDHQTSSLCTYVSDLMPDQGSSSLFIIPQDLSSSLESIPSSGFHEVSNLSHSIKSNAR